MVRTRASKSRPTDARTSLLEAKSRPSVSSGMMHWPRPKTNAIHQASDEDCLWAPE